MKKLFSIFLFCVYLWSSSLLIHAEMMDFAMHKDLSTEIVHYDAPDCSSNEIIDPSWKQSENSFFENTKHHFICCRDLDHEQSPFTTSLSQTEAKPSFSSLSTEHIISLLSTPQSNWHHYDTLPRIVYPPGALANTKYQTFADTVGIIVKLI